MIAINKWIYFIRFMAEKSATFPYTQNITSIEREDFARFVEISLYEDAPRGGATSRALLGKEKKDRNACLIAKEEGILAGLDIFLFVFDKTTNYVNKKVYFKDGDLVKPGDVIVDLTGDAWGILLAERIGLNFLGFLSGIASTTNKVVSHLRQAELEYYKCKTIEELPHQIQILDTRKTLPGYRKLSKYAVYMGGGVNHRLNLSEMGMIKENHIRSFGSITNAAKRFTSVNHDLPFEIEITNLIEAEEVANLADENKPLAVLLDNMKPEMLKKCVSILPKNILTEASGNYNSSNVVNLVGTGVGAVSMGFITKSPGHLDFSLLFENKNKIK